MAEQALTIEVVYAGAQTLQRRTLLVPAGTTVMAAALAAGLAETVPGLQLAADRLGVFGRKVAADHLVAHGDRVEIYRPLSLDPMQARRRRARDPRG